MLAFVYGYWKERGERKNLRVFKFSVQETRLERKVSAFRPIFKFFFAGRSQAKGELAGFPQNHLRSSLSLKGSKEKQSCIKERLVARV